MENKPNQMFVPSAAERAEYREYTKELAWIQHVAPKELAARQIKEAVVIVGSIVVGGWVLRKLLDVAFGVPKVTVKTPAGSVSLEKTED